MERLDRFMARANDAYYAHHDPFQDFTTSPEISQVFGEVLGLWAAVVWSTMGRPDPIHLLELGPGRGTLMRDALRATGQVVPAFRTALRVHLLETSPRLRQVQRAAVPDATWHDTLDTVAPGPLVALGNEFLDALPIRQFVQRGPDWTERWVEDGQFVEHALPDPPPPARGRAGVGVPTAPAPGPGPADEATWEWCQPAHDIVTHLSSRIVTAGGAALFLDYGPTHSAPGDSLQALMGGQPADPLAHPGQADLTAHVDFAALAATARQAGAAVHGPMPQGPFLAQLGLIQRSGRLARGQGPARAGALMQAAQRLTEPDRMGRLFKALAICHPSLPCPPGFETASEDRCQPNT